MHPTETEKAQHTAGKLQVLEDGRARVSLVHVETAWNNPAGGGIPIFSVNKRKLADAERLVACWNALEGIPDPASAVPALVGALEKLLPLAESGRVHHGKFEDTQPIMDQARAALALAQGGKR